ncbi:MAG TPA: SPOR domain-containing protein [Noviherbaspirillum sp.]|jgi:cell division protein FtsN
MKTRQQGGTLLGIIIGLVIGLGIALGVAVTINKTPLPFMDKSGRQAKPEAPNQITDPNKPLYGNKSAAKEAAKDFIKESEPPANTAAQQPDSKAPAPDEIGDKIAEKLKKPEPKAAEVKIGEAPKDPAVKADEDKFNYYLQAGAFREQADAEALRGKLALIGVEAKISERQSENGMLYRVRVGPFGQLDAMNKVRSKLSDNSIDAAVLRVAK